MTNPFLIGEQIYLRPLEMDDLERCQRWFNDPQVRLFLDIIRPLNRTAEKEFLEKLSRAAGSPAGDIITAIVLKDGDRHIGNAGLHRLNLVDRNAEFGIAIGEKDCWHKGYGTEATRLMAGYGFNTLNLHRIYLRVHSNNPRGVSTYEKAGFKQEGVMRQAVFRQDRYHDVILMGLLREEYLASRKKGGR
jgi:RimJ/RimL family protein N-acetyltransferase